ncbi:hypothetical protein ACQP2T_61865 [Nonomuraea sp. CA-143628]|uniref:hypothetical protein n=1 Tax=Nonomuraea sp. CA-143628 TaxID=3239997 RepID=UPI003D9425CF
MNEEHAMTPAELARELGVHRATITRALHKAQAEHQRDQSTPAPPKPVNPDQPLLRYKPSEFMAWWPNRRQRGRPATRSAQAPESNPPEQR